LVRSPVSFLDSTFVREVLRRRLVSMPKRRFSSVRTKLAAISFIKLAKSPFGSR